MRNFSPQLSPIDFNNLIQNPTFSNSSLTVSTDPNYPGKIVIFFQEGTEIDPSSVFTGGNSFLGPDPSALQITREVPGVGNQLIPVDIVADTDRLICQPLPPFAIADGAGNLTTNMPDGQYTIGVFRNIKNTEGKSLRDGPVFHSFTIGATDALPPRVVTTDPVDGEQGVGAGLPPPAPPVGLPTQNVADVTTSIFGATTPDITVRFSEGIAAASVNSGNISVVDAGAFVPGGGNPPQLLPAPGFPKLKSADDGATLPSNGHEIIWRVDPTAGFPFGTQIQVTVLGLYDNVTNEAADADGTNPDNTSPLRDLAGNFMRISSSVQFQTIAPPDLPNNPLPEYSIWYATTNRIGAIDTVNLRGYANFLLGNIQQPIPQNVLPQFSDTVATDQNIPNFDPFEILVDPRHSVFGTCHTYVYVQSNESNQIAIVNSRTSLPIALISTPSPGGIGLSVANNSTDVLVATNAAANTFTAFNLSGLAVGGTTLNAPIFIAKVQGTGNTPTAIAVSTPGRGTNIPPIWNRDIGILGPNTDLIMWADFADGAVNTISLSEDEPVKIFSLGADSAPNDISMSPCLGGLMFIAISQGRSLEDGKVSYYVSGPGCQTGTSTGGAPDALVGSTQETMDAPDGIDQNVAGFGLQAGSNAGPVFVVAESGSTANRVTTLGLTVGAINLPSIEARHSVGANPTSVAHIPAWTLPSVNDVSAPRVASCSYEGLIFWQWVTTPAGIQPLIDGQYESSLELYVCAQGAGQVNVVNMLSGTPSFYQPIPIDGIRHVASQASQ